MDQPTFAGLEYQGKKRKTRRELFLERVDGLIPWQLLEDRIRPFDEWTEVFGSERLTGALLDRLTHHVHILEMNGESYRLKRSREGVASQTQDKPHEE